MEIYVNSANRDVSLEVPVTPISGTLDVTILDANGALQHTVDTVVSSNGVLSFTFPFSLAQGDADYTVVWEFNYTEDGVDYPFSTNTAVSVVTPILPLSEIASILEVSVADEAVANTESGVRYIIRAHTGQSFGFYKNKTIAVEGHGDTALRLPERLVNMTGLATLSANLEPTSTIVTSDGWYLKKGWAHEISAISNNSQYWGGGSGADVPANDPDGDGIWTLPISGEPGYEKTGHGIIISAPGYGPSPTPWRDDYPFKITGDWGYPSVPNPVKEAARLLINDYGCREAAYRDRYLQSMKAADWRLQFTSRSWEYTGNVRADQLLSEYVLLDWAVI